MEYRDSRFTPNRPNTKWSAMKSVMMKLSSGPFAYKLICETHHNAYVFLKS